MQNYATKNEQLLFINSMDINTVVFVPNPPLKATITSQHKKTHILRTYHSNECLRSQSNISAEYPSNYYCVGIVAKHMMLLFMWPSPCSFSQFHLARKMYNIYMCQPQPQCRCHNYNYCAYFKLLLPWSVRHTLIMFLQSLWLMVPYRIKKAVYVSCLCM